MHNTDKIISRIENKFFKTKKIKKGDTLIIGLSGGADSMCLLDIMYKLKEIYEYNLIALHIHHGIRGMEADNDLSFTKKYCHDFKIEFKESHVDAISYAKKYSLTLEESARKLRYEEYDKVWKETLIRFNNANVYLLIAHHMRDQVETIIHNMIRGTGIKGLSGMKEESGYILRPLLDIEKNEIDAYIKKYDIPYVNDSTNDDTNYTRNYIRKNIVSSMEKINDKVYEHIAEIGKTALEINNYLEYLSKSLLKNITIEKDSQHIIINLTYFRNSSHIIKVYIIREIFLQLVSTLKDFTKKHIEDIIIMSTKEKGGHLDMPYNITVDKKGKNIVFSHNNDNISMKRKVKK